MTPQEIFDTVWHAMKAQGRRSVNRNGLCRYRSPNGDKCAVGCLISDEHYNDMLRCHEGDAVCDIPLPSGLDEHINLLAGLQNAHDDSCGDFWPEFSHRARRIAKNHGLTIPENEQ